MESNKNLLELKHLKSTALSINKISKLVDEVAQGEACFIEAPEKVLEVRMKLGIEIEGIKR